MNITAYYVKFDQPTCRVFYVHLCKNTKKQCSTKWEASLHVYVTDISMKFLYRFVYGMVSSAIWEKTCTSEFFKDDQLLGSLF